MKIKTFCSLTIIPTLILILLLLSSVDNYLPQTQVFSQFQNDTEIQQLDVSPMPNETTAVLNDTTLINN
jgi:hypothetical protein